MPLQDPHRRHDTGFGLLHFFMGNMLPTELAELITLQPIRIVLLILVGRIVPLLADRAR